MLSPVVTNAMSAMPPTPLANGRGVVDRPVGAAQPHVAASGVGEQVAAVVLGRPMTIGDERAGRDDLADGARVIGDRIRESCGQRRVRARWVLADRTLALAEGPPVVRADRAEVDLFAGALTDVVDEEPCRVQCWDRTRTGTGCASPTRRSPGTSWWAWKADSREARQLSEPGPLMGLPGAGSPVDGTTRRILPLSRLRSWAASFGLDPPRGSAPASPTEMYRKPSPPISTSPPL